MTTHHAPRALHFLVVLLSVCSTAVYASFLQPGSLGSAGALLALAYLGGVVMPFVLRALLNTLSARAGSSFAHPVVPVVIAIFLPFVVIPMLVVQTARAVAEAPRARALHDVQAALARARSLAIAYGLSTFFLPSIAAGIVSTLVATTTDGEGGDAMMRAFALAPIVAGVVNATLLAWALSFVMHMSELVVAEARARPSLGGTGGAAPVGVKSV